MATEGSQDAQRQEFFKVLLRESFKKLFIPPKFTLHLVNGNRQKATILSPLGKFWHVDLQREGRDMFFGSGWENFVKAHGLSVGDFLVFRYHGNMVFTIKIFDKSGCLKEYDFTASTYVNNEEVDVDVEIPDHAPTVQKGRKNPKSSQRVQYFERIVKRYNVASMRIGVPKPFCLLNGLTTMREITLKDGKQRPWPVLFRLNSRGGHIGKGWRFFSEANNLKEGDKCIFEFVSKNVMQVRIVRG